MSTNSFFESEIRGRFEISEVMKHCWASDLKVLSDIRSVCDTNGLHFFAAYGTLLGAVRHGGYIPWDDDIDIGMVRDDYIALLDILEKDEGKGFEVLNPYTKPWYCMNFSHLNCADDLRFDRSYLQDRCGCPFVTGPDIFPYYYIPRNKNDEEFILYILDKIDRTMAMSRQPVQNGLNEAVAISLVELQHETGYVFNTERPIDNQLEMLYDQVCALTPSEDADYLTRYDEYTKDKNKKFPKEYLENVIYLPFENTEIPVPLGYRDVLLKRFGSSYLIPKREAAAHDYPFFKKQMRAVGNRMEEEALKNSSSDIPAPQKDASKKTVLYYTSLREMIIYNEKVIDKIRNVISFFKGNADKYNFIWITGEFLKSDEFAFDEIAPILISDYENVIEEYKKTGLEIYPESDNTDKYTEIADIYFGDESLISEAFNKQGLPVFIQDYSDHNCIS